MPLNSHAPQVGFSISESTQSSFPWTGCTWRGTPAGNCQSYPSSQGSPWSERWLHLDCLIGRSYSSIRPWMPSSCAFWYTSKWSPKQVRLSCHRHKLRPRRYLPEFADNSLQYPCRQSWILGLADHIPSILRFGAISRWLGPTLAQIHPGSILGPPAFQVLFEPIRPCAFSWLIRPILEGALLGWVFPIFLLRSQTLENL